MTKKKTAKKPVAKKPTKKKLVKKKVTKKAASKTPAPPKKPSSSEVFTFKGGLKGEILFETSEHYYVKVLNQDNQQYVYIRKDIPKEAA